MIDSSSALGRDIFRPKFPQKEEEFPRHFLEGLRVQLRKEFCKSLSQSFLLQWLRRQLSRSASAVAG